MTPTIRRRCNLRGRRGSLEQLPNMPLELLFQTFSRMEPVDLLHLARTSKAFRQLLMDEQDAASFWKIARNNVPGLPDCPSFMNEPAYANLCFDSHCHKCLRPNVSTILWSFRARYCRACKHQMTISASAAMETLNAVSSFQRHYDIRRVLVSGQYEHAWKGTFHLPDVEALVERWKDSDAQMQESIYSEQSELVEQIQEVSFPWRSRGVFLKRKRALEAQRKQRYLDITSKLGQLGWGKLLDSYPFDAEDRLSKITGVRQPRPLTDRSWKNMQGPVLAVMETLREEGDILRRKAALPSRIRLLSDVMHKFRAQFGLVFPGVLEFAQFAQVRSILDVPGEVELSYQNVDVVLPALAGLIQQWKAEKTQNLRKVLAKEITFVPDGTDVLELAVTLYYRCLLCRNTCTFPSILSHTCQRVPSPYTSIEDYYTSILNSESLGLPFPWTPNTITVEAQVLQTVIANRGRDPSIVTIAQMDRLDAIERRWGLYVFPGGPKPLAICCDTTSDIGTIRAQSEFVLIP